MNTIETRLVDEISKLSNQVNFALGEREARHSQFLLEVIDDMKHKLDSIRGHSSLPRSSQVMG